uniref:Uncharacterized protein n=1 Tax=Rhodococcus ruber TaxID=1830 RepID=A0A866W082_9NOCA|nr:hypothetical protein [Rhodococcus ruber]
MFDRPISPKECGVDQRVIVAVNGIACRILSAGEPTLRKPVTAEQAMESGLVREVVPLASAALSSE